MQQAVAPRQDLDDRAEIEQPQHGPVVHLSDLHVGRELHDAPLRLATLFLVDAGDDDGAVVLDIDLGSRLLGQRANHGAALADHVADLLRIDLHPDHPRSISG